MPEAAGVELASVNLPWGAWHGDHRQTLPVPSGWQIRQLRMQDARALSDLEIGQALDAPVDGPSLRTLSAGKRRVAIAIDDITRPTRTEPLLRLLIDRLTEAGLTPGEITIVVATGAHRRASERDLELKIGRELLGRIRVISHDPAGDLVTTGAALGGVPVRINREFAAADLRIGIGAVLPHAFAGFSGGGKVVIPGLADLDVLARTHKFALMGFKGGSHLDGNRFRSEMEEAVRQIGLHWTVNVAVNSQRETAFVSAGDVVTAHRAAAAASARLGATDPPDDLLDALILNAYPKDGELLQIEGALVALRNGMLDWLAPGSPVILTAACPDGLGHHGLFGPGGRLCRTPGPKSFLGDRDLWVFAPGMAASDVRTVFAERYPSYSTWQSLVDALNRRLRGTPSVGLVSCGPLQLARRDSAKGQPMDTVATESQA
jgi:nickel-dependent lactate racemase